MKLVSLSDIFYIEYGNGLELNKLDIADTNGVGINFVSRTSKNNGVSDVVKEIPTVRPFGPGLLTVALGGSVLETFLQPEPFYTSYHVMVLAPKLKMSDTEMLYYCSCIKQNKYRYSYGRQANKTLKNLKVPAQVPTWITKFTARTKLDISGRLSKDNRLLQTDNWKSFKYEDVFLIENGYYNKKPPINDNGGIPFIGASEYDNGVTSYHLIDDIRKYNKDGTEKELDNISERIYKGNCITVANNGNSVASAFYQESDFTCTHDVNVLRLKEVNLNKYIALFLCALIKLERFRWSYGRKWRPIRMPFSDIKLPVDKEGNPDWNFMENYIKTLPYSVSI